MFNKSSLLHYNVRSFEQFIPYLYFWSVIAQVINEKLFQQFSFKKHQRFFDCWYCQTSPTNSSSHIHSYFASAAHLAPTHGWPLQFTCDYQHSAPYNGFY